MKLRTKLVIYFALVHLVPASALFFLANLDRTYLALIEALLAISLLAGLAVANALARPFALIENGTELIREEDFSSTFRYVGQPELDRLIDIYNIMLSRLREERLRVEEQSSLVSKLIELSPSGVVLLDLDGRIQQMNPSAAKLLGLRDEDIGRQLDEIDNVHAPALVSMTSGEAKMLVSDGRQRLRCWRGEFFDRGFLRPFFIVEELTEELRASEKAAYDKVIRMLSHEINNSVGAVASLLDTLQHYAAALQSEQRDDFARAISVATARLRSLDSFTRGFASVVRIPAPEISDVDLTALVRDILTLVEPELVERRLVVDAQYDGGSHIAADKNQIEQVVLNVVRNAIEASPDGATLHVEVRGRDEVTLRVRDEGSGISADVQKHLFTPFFTSKPRGRGLGLTIIQEILTNHGATFSLQSSPDGGAEFSTTFRRP